MACKIIFDESHLTLADNAAATLDVYAITQCDAQGTERMIDAYSAHFPLDTQQAQVELADYRQQDVLFAKIAREALGIKTLAARNMDSLDFHEVSVGSVKVAPRRAYEAGREAVK